MTLLAARRSKTSPGFTMVPGQLIHCNSLIASALHRPGARYNYACTNHRPLAEIHGFQVSWGQGEGTMIFPRVGQTLQGSQDAVLNRCHASKLFQSSFVGCKTRKPTLYFNSLGLWCVENLCPVWILAPHITAGPVVWCSCMLTLLLMKLLPLFSFNNA